MPWDQRIPNEPIFTRNFFIERPVIIPSERPYSTYCTGKTQIGVFNEERRYDDISRQMMQTYYMDNIVNDKGGLPVLSVKNQKGKREVIQTFKKSAYLSAVHYNIESETKVKPYKVLTSKDCIGSDKLDDRLLESFHKLKKQESFHKLKKQERQERQEKQERQDMRWDINTSRKFLQRPPVSGI